MTLPKLQVNRKAITKGVLFCMPFVLFFGAVLCLTLWAGTYLLNDSPLSAYYGLLFRGSVGDGSVSAGDASLIEPILVEEEYLEGEFVTPGYGTQWATMNVTGWAEKDIPVYYGNSQEILRHGAAQAQFSRFCGQNGKVVLSAHVTRHFAEMEDAVAAFEAGEEILITLDTLWGRYVYRAREVVLFDYLDADPLLPEPGEETLFFYTCYPKRNWGAARTQRIGFDCELVEGVSWRDYVQE